MSMSLELSFKSSLLDQWLIIFEGLSRGETGARFQDRMDLFGEAVAEQLEDLLERWPGEYFLVSSYDQKGESMQVEFVAGPDAAKFAQEMGALFVACGVTDLRCRGIDLSGD